MLRRIRDGLLDILFPCRCLACGADTTRGEDRGAVICAPCLDAIPVHSALFCSVCSGRVPLVPSRCHRAPFLAGGAASYDNAAVKELVKVLKYDGVRSAAKPLGTLVARFIVALAAAGTLREDALVVPVPLSAARERSRGYNQAEEIARSAAGLLRLPLEPDLLTRTRHTRPQTEITGRDERRKNVLGSFSASERVRGRVVVVIDDVYTTGATMHEAARALKSAGARRVYGITAARA